MRRSLLHCLCDLVCGAAEAHPVRRLSFSHKKDGFRILVERLWPRGLSKSRAQVALWLKDIVPSPQLRTWYGHELAKRQEFQRRYRAELQINAAVEQLQQLQQDKPIITFMYAARDTAHNSALVLKAFLEEYPQS